MATNDHFQNDANPGRPWRKVGALMGLNPMPERERCPGCGADASHASAHRHPASSLPNLDPEVRAHDDGILFWSCRRCRQTWHHWDLTSPLHHIAAKYMTAPPSVVTTQIKTGAEQDGRSVA